MQSHILALLNLILIYSICIIYAEDNLIGDCVLRKHKASSQRTGLIRLQKLVNEKFTVVSGDFTYTVSICKSLTTDKAGVTQYKKKPESTFNLGRVTDTDIFAGDGWMLLEYGSGDSRRSTCQKENRRTMIMITCAPTIKFRYVEENNSKNESCYYLFELEHPKACDAVAPSGRSAGTIFCIIFFTFLLAYIVFGFLYMRFVKGQRGVNQIPNLHFWYKCGNLIADGTDFLCRCDRSSPNGLSASSSSPREYKPVDNNYTGTTGNESTILDQPDEHLLSL